jgi:hypothetical protein
MFLKSIKMFVMDKRGVFFETRTEILKCYLDELRL